MYEKICFFSITLFVSLVLSANINRDIRRGVVSNLLREMVNQTKADTLNLPANASSIRENITDTFSCENKTYGYYADVDNDCQVFHVCLTRSAGSRNTTYRWSFICPKETVFNQEVLTCTYPRDSIDCEESPMFYHVNMDIGKISNDTEQIDKTDAMKTKRKKPMKKQNLIVETLMKEIENEKIEELSEEISPVVEETFAMEPESLEIRDEVNDVREVNDDRKGDRMFTERNFKRRQGRGSFRFKHDV